VPGERPVGLLPIPRTSVGSAQPGHDAQEIEDALAAVARGRIPLRYAGDRRWLTHSRSSYRGRVPSGQAGGEYGIGFVSTPEATPASNSTNTIAPAIRANRITRWASRRLAIRCGAPGSGRTTARWWPRRGPAP